MLKEFSDELVPLIIPAKGGGTQAVRAVLTSSTADKDWFERELQNLEEEQNKRVRGFQEISVIHSEFLSPLPTNVDEFMGSLHSVFPHILDVNHLMKNIGPLRRMTNIPAAISYLNNHYFAAIDMEILPQESEGNIQRHNVVKMCYLFAKLCSILKISDNAMVSNNAMLGMIKSLLCKLHAVFSEEFDVRLLDKSCAIVVFWRRGLSETFLDAMSSEEICDSLMEIASEGIRASSYETYKKVCRLGLWEADMAESLDKALEDLDYLTEVNSTTNSKEIYWSSN
nr:poly(A)-specific ribonuclease PARN-like [Malus domestica]XP_028958254.1 poly(A)-specific ribonuclease PARN-like [Malus domestica]